jgi:hypothetical protein
MSRESSWRSGLTDTGSHTITFDQLLPVFLSTEVPREKTPLELPLRFVGGFGYDAQTIGVVIAFQGVYSLFTNSVLFPWAVGRFGTLGLFRLLASTYFLLYLTTPYLVLLPQSLQLVGIYATVIVKCTFSTMAYPSNAILTKNAASGSLWLGTIMGVHGSAASLCRALGPTVAGLLYARGLESGYSGLPWWSSGLVTLVGAAIAWQLREEEEVWDEKTDEAEPDATLPLVAGDNV